MPPPRSESRHVVRAAFLGLVGGILALLLQGAMLANMILQNRALMVKQGHVIRYQCGEGGTRPGTFPVLKNRQGSRPPLHHR